MTSDDRARQKIITDQADLCNKLGLVKAKEALVVKLFKMKNMHKGGQSTFSVNKKDGSTLNPDIADTTIKSALKKRPAETNPEVKRVPNKRKKKISEESSHAALNNIL